MNDPNNQDFWEQKWQVPAGTLPGWDLKGRHPLLDDLVQLARHTGSLKAGSRILVPGCGRAHDAWALSRMGYRVLALDIVPTAIIQAKALYPADDNFQVVLGNVFAAGLTYRAAFDGIFDRAMLCALEPDRRLPYVTSMADCLVTGGLFMSIGFAKVNLDRPGPPFEVGQKDLMDLFCKRFSLAAAEEREDGAVDQVIVREILNIWRKVGE